MQGEAGAGAVTLGQGRRRAGVQGGGCRGAGVQGGEGGGAGVHVHPNSPPLLDHEELSLPVGLPCSLQ